MPHKLIGPDTWIIRQQVMQKYGGSCTCPCGCGSTNLRHLQLHHVNGGGTKEREMGQVRGKNLYIKLLANPVDPDLKPLCVACHWEVTMFGVCENTPLSYEERKEIPEVQTEGEAWPAETSVVTPAPFAHRPPALRVSEVYDPPPPPPPVDPYHHLSPEGIAEAERSARTNNTSRPSKGLFRKLWTS